MTDWKIGTLSTSIPAVLGAFVAVIYGCIQRKKARKRHGQSVRMSRWRAQQQDSVEFIEGLYAKTEGTVIIRLSNIVYIVTVLWYPLALVLHEMVDDDDDDDKFI